MRDNKKEEMPNLTEYPALANLAAFKLESQEKDRV